MAVNKYNNAKLNNWINSVQQFMFGSPCELCGREHDRLGICTSCRTFLPYVRNSCFRCGLPFSPQTHSESVCGRCLYRPPPYDHVVAPFWYQWPVDDWLLRYKFHADWPAGALFGKWLVDAIKREDAIALPDLIVPVPMHTRRVRKRGYNPAGDLARFVARKLSLSMAHNIVMRKRYTPAQIDLPYKARIKNIRHAFESKPIDQSCHIAIVDDVMTTGATVAEIAKTLRKAGSVGRISVWVVARALSSLR